MRFTLITDDRLVLIDGDPRVLDKDVEVPAEIHAVQWYDTYGEIEYKPVGEGLDAVRRKNEKFFDLSRFESFVQAYHKAVDRDNAEIAADKKRVEDERKRLEELIKASNGG